jgi:hypothetical protein
VGSLDDWGRRTYVENGFVSQKKGHGLRVQGSVETREARTHSRGGRRVFFRIAEDMAAKPWLPAVSSGSAQMTRRMVRERRPD